MWYSIYTVGDIDIDQEHANIDFMLSVLDSEPGELESTLLENIIDVTLQHFSNEETIAKERGYNMTAQHLAKHQQLTKELLIIKQSLQNNTISRESVPVMLQDILHSHILEFDRFLIA
ncbi:hemerythrin domain-containing protein [Desulfogranum marinum]|uniref:hemerythrin domain-containing protein n=1 Tax=Desulfogranum marinum TaxID=453220 RepID=UPI0029C82B8B|nr:hemerythrin domain-containing protein [Desulfogranum marinum]